ncbi:MAG: NADH-quinone oxidoreductase subunit I [Mycobacteriales bacterium]|nr:NADH-quinone oxidoreductase subunit I [Frankia sp.]
MAAPGVGLAKGLAVTLKTMMHRSVTKQYPDVKPALPPRTRGVIALMEENCTVCMLCSRECPDWCIYIDSHKETVPPKTPGARARTRNILDRFAIDFALCMYCGICIEVCPFDALFWSPEFEYSEHDIRELTHEMDRLREWMYTVPAPPATDPDGEAPKELEAAAKAEPKVYEAVSLVPDGAPTPSSSATRGPNPAAAVPAAGGAPGVAIAPAAPAHEQGGPAAAAEPDVATRQPASEAAAAVADAEHDIGEVQVDQQTYDAAIAAGLPDRVARAKAKSAWVKKARKGLV